MRLDRPPYTPGVEFSSGSRSRAQPSSSRSILENGLHPSYVYTVALVIALVVSAVVAPKEVKTLNFVGMMDSGWDRGWGD